MNMAFQSGTAYPESDADDEYERSLHGTSPLLAVDDEEGSITESEGLDSANEHTPTYQKRGTEDQFLNHIITEWTAEDSAEFVGSLGFRQYADTFRGK